MSAQAEARVMAERREQAMPPTPGNPALVVAQALIEYGDALRGDWSDFDGRSAKAALHDFAFELRGEREPHTIEQHRDELGLCPDGAGHWGGRWGHCDTHNCPTYLAEEQS